MKLNKVWSLLLALCLALTFTACGNKPASEETTPSASVSASASALPQETTAATPTPEPQPVYKDGTYEITTDNDIEGYFVKASLTIKDGKIADFQYNIYDSRHDNVIFDENYEQFMGQQIYKQQCRDDLAGMKTYGPKLVETQSVDEVDVVSKATWTWKWFKKVAQELLDQAAAK